MTGVALTERLEHLFYLGLFSNLGTSKRSGDAKPVKRAVYVVVDQELRAYTGLLLGWRKDKDSNGFARWWAKVIFLDGDGLLHEGWFPAARVKPAPYAEPAESYYLSRAIRRAGRVVLVIPRRSRHDRRGP